MRKKLITLSLLLVLATTMLSTLFVGCSKIQSTRPDGENLAANATFNYSKDKTSKDFKLTNKSSQVTVVLPEEKEINTIVLREKTSSVSAFEVWIPVVKKGENGEPDKTEQKLLYKQDEINGLRFCYIDNIKVKEMTIRAFSVGKQKFTIDKFELYNTQRPQKDFRITTYIPVNEFVDGKVDTEGLRHVTDVILFGQAIYSEKGDIALGNAIYDKDGKPTYDDKGLLITQGRETLDKAIAIIKATCGEKMPRLFVNFMPNNTLKNTSGLSNEKFFASVQKIAFKDNRANFIANLSKCLDELPIDGLSFDYEYPYTQDDYTTYGDFLIALKGAIPNKLISIAVAPWGIKYSKKAIEAVDMFEVMAYDLMDKRGNHSGWKLACTDAIDYMIKKGFPKEKLDLGVPFYSRPVDYGAFWGGWSGEYQNMSEFSNYIASEFVTTDYDGNTFLVKARWYNGVNMIQDKTAFAYDSGLGGMMIWHYNCDLPYSHERSLLRAMNNIFD
ncbi:MAG: glycoside hydrolase family 18 protein [Clostridia bacterium]